MPDAEGSAAGRRKAEESNPGGGKLGNAELDFAPNPSMRRVPLRRHRCCKAPETLREGAGPSSRRAEDRGRATGEQEAGVEQMAGGKPNSEWRGAGGEQLANRRWGRAASEREAERWGAAAGKRERRIGEGIAFAGRGGRIGMASGFRRIRVGKRRNPNVSRKRCGR